ncbi:MAG: sigma-70 family RNA polymerase sigma factor [Chitinophagales bacterium]|nr:sigma-70 family RNA polymerase sigma factor [Chitinophagales bacterium]
MNQDKEWIQQLAQGNEDCLGHIYQKYRLDIINWLVTKRQCTLDEAKEIYQITILTLYENVLNGKLVELTSSLKTYLFAIGKNKLKEHQRKKSKIVDGFLFDHIPFEATLEEKYQLEEMFQQVEAALKQMGEACRKILELFYYKKCSFKTISTMLQISSIDAAKMKKKRCLDKLRKLV